MHYFGGKARIAKPLSEFINSKLQENQPFIDLFCGSCNVISKINPNRTRIANDLHPELMAMHKAVQSNIAFPDHISEEEYQQIRISGEDWLKGFVGFGLSYAGKWWGGYARDGTTRNYCMNAKNSLLKKHKTLKDVIFTQGSYGSCELPNNSLIYCDIPYKNTTKYSVGNFDHNEFYKWAENKQSEGHEILVSEYKDNLPANWKVVWEHQSKKDIRNSNYIQETTIEILMSP